VMQATRDSAARGRSGKRLGMQLKLASGDKAARSCLHLFHEYAFLRINIYYHLTLDILTALNILIFNTFYNVRFQLRTDQGN
ncbi:MAG: hypothetical protein K2I09_01590, partial [Duncaniella sp.]|nr:hypothetical protein [Duncaniella sp.]